MEKINAISFKGNETNTKKKNVTATKVLGLGALAGGSIKGGVDSFKMCKEISNAGGVMNFIKTEGGESGKAFVESITNMLQESKINLNIDKLTKNTIAATAVALPALLCLAGGLLVGVIADKTGLTDKVKGLFASKDAQKTEAKK
ncbi:MAG: hypothetical protein IJ877_03600 [Candidatus Gastranaerophilales bacterium]|nr:hypothetical protein [Candidatus Gastranaerophilales bacterium]